MKHIYSFLVSIGLSIVIVSCQREVDGDLPGPPGGNDSIYLSSYVEIDTTYPSGQDTVAKFLYDYDAQKRVVRAIHMYPWFGTTLGNTDSLYTYYFYNGTEKLPYKAVYDIDARVDNSDDTAFFTYSNGFVVRDSTVSHYHTPTPSVHREIVTYTPSGNNTILHGRRYSDAFLLDDWTGTIFQTRVAGNITAQSDTCTLPHTFTVNDNVIATYDNKPDPFYAIGPAYLVSSGGDQKNNELTSTVRRYSQEDHFRTEYIYRADGYPVIARYYHQEDPTYIPKGYFYYTK